MAANSKHWADVRNWLVDIIRSCETRDHWFTTRRLLDLYKDKYPSKGDYDSMYLIHEGLERRLDNKWYEIDKSRK